MGSGIIPRCVGRRGSKPGLRDHRLRGRRTLSIVRPKARSSAGSSMSARAVRYERRARLHYAGGCRRRRPTDIDNVEGSVLAGLDHPPAFRLGAVSFDGMDLAVVEHDVGGARAALEAVAGPAG